MAYLAAKGSLDSIPVGVRELLPGRDTITYIPQTDDRFQAGPLWREELFPLLWKDWESQRLPFMEYCNNVAERGRLNRDSEDGLWTMSTTTAEFQLRAYLWHYFRWVQVEGVKAVLRAPFGWIEILAYLARAGPVHCISYNYDLFLEACLQAVGRTPGSPVEDAGRLAEMMIDQDSATHSLVLKPHGSIGHNLRGFLIGPNAWQSSVVLHASELRGCRTECVWPPDGCPWLPDLVPPGHTYEHTINPNATLAVGCERVLAAADNVVVCGLSGAEPDTAELRRVFSAVRPSARIFHMETSGDVPMTQILVESPSKHYRFIDASTPEYASAAIRFLRARR